MRKIFLVFSFLLLASVSSAQYRILGFYSNSIYGDYVIVYGYHDSTGVFRMSHCRTNVAPVNIYSNLAYLDIDTCEIKIIADEATAAVPVVPPPPTPKLEKAF